MKLSCEVKPPKGYKNTRGQRYRVTLDGKPLQHCVRVDTCTGVAVVAVTDERGCLVIDRRRNEVRERAVYGSLRAVPDPLPW